MYYGRLYSLILITEKGISMSDGFRSGGRAYALPVHFRRYLALILTDILHVGI